MSLKKNIRVIKEQQNCINNNMTANYFLREFGINLICKQLHLKKFMK